MLPSINNTLFAINKEFLTPKAFKNGIRARQPNNAPIL
jgi:hypothetical protein